MRSRVRAGRAGAPVVAAALVSAALAVGGTPARAADWVIFRDHAPESGAAASVMGGPTCVPAGARSVLGVASRRLRRPPPGHTAGPPITTTQEPTPRAVARRAKADRERSHSGLPAAAPDAGGPCAAYVDAVAATGAVIRTYSSWLNAVSVEADATALEFIRALPFVLETRPVLVAEGDSELGVDGINPGGSARQLDMLHVPEAHDMGYHGEGILIAVLDSGFNLEHEAFRHLEVRAQRDFLNGDDDPSYDPRTDAPGQANHGTQVLSILAGYAPGRLVGPAFAADFVLAKTERTSSETAIEEDFWVAGIEWAEAMGADIATSSLSYPNWYRWRDMDGRTAVATRAANVAHERGLLVFNSVGNQGPREGRLGAPADAPGAVSVGAVDANGRVWNSSTVGPTWDGRVKPDVCAMGVQVTHATARTRDRYGRGNGTSYATPLVAGCAALVMQAHPDWGPEMVREALAMSADLAAAPDNRRGWGVVNVRDAIVYPQIEGRVGDLHTHEPLAGARVAWEPAGAVDSPAAAGPADSPPRGTARTDSTGAYLIPSLPRGTYRLRISADGYFDAVSEPIEVPPGIGDVNFELRYRGE